jgi:hypothetical protein
MNEAELMLPFNRLCREAEKNIDTMTAKKADFLRSFRRVHVTDFKAAVDKLVNDSERYQRFPTTGEMWKYIKRTQKTAPERKYPDCKACDNSADGLVTMILGYKIKDNEDKIVERYHWSLAKKIELRKKNNGIRYYDFSFACRCERGLAFCNARGGSPPPITPEEFEELKAYNESESLKNSGQI